MRLNYTTEHTSCMNYKTNAHDGFTLEFTRKGEVFDNHATKGKAHHLIFLLEGKVRIVKDDDHEKTIQAGEFVFIPISSHFVGTVMESGKVLRLVFYHGSISLCDKHMLESYLKEVPDYDRRFDSLSVREPLDLFLQLLEIYLEAGVNCRHLHEIKEKELFIIFRTAYTKAEMVQLLHPIMGVRVDFKAIILEHKDKVASREELARITGMSVQDLSRKFNEEFGEPVYTWLLKQKNRRILAMMSYPSMTIKEVIHKFGFSSAPSFNRYCKQNFGCSPTELKDKIREGKEIKHYTSGRNG